MDQTLVVVLTAIIAIATTVYTFYSVQLYRANQAAKEIARHTAFIQLWTRMVTYIGSQRDAPTRETEFLGEFSDCLLRLIVGELMEEIKRSKSPHASRFRNEMHTLLARHDLSGTSMEWLTSVMGETGPGVPKTAP